MISTTLPGQTKWPSAFPSGNVCGEYDSNAATISWIQLLDREWSWKVGENSITEIQIYGAGESKYIVIYRDGHPSERIPASHVWVHYA